MPSPAARMIAPPCPPSRSAGRRRPFTPSPLPGPYRLPTAVLERLTATLQPFRNRDAALALAAFLGRFWSAPRRVALAFPVDRRALARHPALGLTEDRIRGAIATLERIGFITREVAPPGRRYQRTADGLQRRPLAFRFGLDVMPDFLAANTRRKAARQRPTAARDARSPVRRPSIPSPALRPSLVFPAAIPNAPLSSPVRTTYRIALFSGDLGSQPLPWMPRPMPIPPAADLSAAIDRIRAARARALGGGQ